MAAPTISGAPCRKLHLTLTESYEAVFVENPVSVCVCVCVCVYMYVYVMVCQYYINPYPTNVENRVSS